MYAHLIIVNETDDSLLMVLSVFIPNFAALTCNYV